MTVRLLAWDSHDAFADNPVQMFRCSDLANEVHRADEIGLCYGKAGRPVYTAGRLSDLSGKVIAPGSFKGRQGPADPFRMGAVPVLFQVGKKLGVPYGLWRASNREGF